MRSQVRGIASCLCLVALLAACASTTVGRGIQIAEAQKLLVERAAVELIKLNRQGKLPDADLAAVRAVYERWRPLQAALAEAMAQWRLVASAENNERVEAALRAVAAVTEEYLRFAGQWLDLQRLGDRAP